MNVLRVVSGLVAVAAIVVGFVCAELAWVAWGASALGVPATVATLEAAP